MYTININDDYNHPSISRDTFTHLLCPRVTYITSDLDACVYKYPLTYTTHYLSVGMYYVLCTDNIGVDGYIVSSVCVP